VPALALVERARAQGWCWRDAQAAPPKAERLRRK
jgi:hypothetical protein